MKTVIALAVAILISAMPAFALAAPGKISVQGQASVFVEPDTASLSLGVEITRSEAREAQDEVNKVINASVDALTALDIPANKIQTEVVNVNPNYNYESNERKLIGYVASTVLTVKLDDIELVGQAIDAAMTAGANNVYGVNFSTSKHNDCYDQALMAAIQDARHKAELIAAADGLEIVGVNSISENSSNGMYYAKATAEYSVADAGAGNATNVSAGLIEVDANVTAEHSVDSAVIEDAAK